MPTRTPNKLRADVEAETQRRGVPHVIDALMEALPADEAAEVADLLTGQPWVRHTVCARVLIKHYPEHLPMSAHKLSERIGEWRRTRGLSG